MHGTTTDNENGFATGWLPGELSQLGIRQAKDLGIIVSDKEFDVVFCSDLKRAIDSTQLGFGDRYEIIEDVRLRECNYGELNGAGLEELKDKKEYIYKRYPEGENYQDVEQRIAEFLEFIKENYNDKSIAIIAHQAPQLALEVLLNGKTWEQAFADDWRNTKAWQPGWEYQLN